MKNFLVEARLVDMGDGDLKEYLGYIYHSLRNVIDARKYDPEIERLKGVLRAYIEERYGDDERLLKAQMTAARSLAEARGIHWKCPE